MAYKVYLNKDNLIFDSSLQDESFLFTRAIVHVQAGSAGSFDFVMAPTHEYYDQLHQLTDYIDVFRDDEIIFSGRIYSITTQFDLQKSVSCEGLLAVLADSIYRPVTFQGDVVGLVTDIINQHNTQVDGRKQIALGNITVENSGVYRDYQNYETSISRLQDLVNTFGGYLMIWKEYTSQNPSVVDIGIVDECIVDVGSDVVLYLDWLDEFTTPCTQAIELTSNLITLKKTQASDDIVTALIPIGSADDDGNRLTIESVNNGLDFILASAEEIAEHGLIMKAVVWNDVTVASNLLRKGQDYLTAALTPKMEIQLTAVDLADTGEDIDSFRVGQKISVTSKPHGLDAVLFSCVEQTLDLLQPAQNRITLGEVKSGYVQAQRAGVSPAVLDEIESQRKVTTQMIRNATETITGNLGGYLCIHDSDGDGEPDELLIMDTPDIDTAVKIWRFNNSGLGYSENGYNGPYGLAMTMDGRIVADFITAGTMLANRIKGGTLSLGGINNESGQMVVYDENGSIIGKWDKDGALISGDLQIVKDYLQALIGTFTYLSISNTSTGATTELTATGFKVFDSHYSPETGYFAIAPVHHNTLGAYQTTVEQKRKIMRGSLSTETTVTSVYPDDLVISQIYNNTAGAVARTYLHETIYDSMWQHEIYRAGSSTGRARFRFGIDSADRVYLQLARAGYASTSPSAGLLCFYDDTFYINGVRAATASTSSRRYKEDITDLEDPNLDPHKLLELPVKQFRYKDGVPLQYADMEDQLLPGFIAEEVAEIYPAATIRDKYRNIESWDERRIIPGMLALIQEQQKEIQQLKAELEEIKEALK